MNASSANEDYRDGGLRERMYRVRAAGRTVQREEALSLLREVYRELMDARRPDLLAKIEKIALIARGGVQ